MNAACPAATCRTATRTALLRRVAGAGLAVAVVLAAGAVSAQQALQPAFYPDNQTILQNYSAEFPPIGPAYAAMRGGLMAARAAALIERAPAAPETFEMLLYLERPVDAAAVLQRLLEADPGAAARPFELVADRFYLFGAAAVSGTELLPALLDSARTQLARLTGDEAARLERALLLLETRTAGAGPNAARAAALRDFIARYPGTDAAHEAEIDLIAATTSNRAAWIRLLEEIAQRYPGTTAAARALYEKAFQLSSNLNPRGGDPTDRFLEAIAIATDLGSGRYPPSEWVSRAPALVEGLSPREPVFAPGSADRLLAGYIAYVREHFTLPEDSQGAANVASIITYQIFNLFNARGEGIAGVERTLAGLESIDAPRARDIRAAFYIGRISQEPAGTRSALLQRAHELLAAQLQGPDGLYRRRALAMQASLYHLDGDVAAAQAAFARYLATYPDTPWSWVAALRVGQYHLVLGDPDAAAAAFRDAAARYGDIRVARELGHAYAGHAAETAGRFEEAAADYERALDQWGDLQRTARMGDRAGDLPGGWPFAEVQGLALRERVVQIRASMRFPEGPLLERGRRLAAIGSRTEALAAVDELLRTYPGSTLAAEARRLAHRMRLDAALDLAAPSSDRPGDPAPLDALTALAQEPWDAVIGVAKVVRATLLATRGLDDLAHPLMVEALGEWQDRQTTSAAGALPADVASDVADIRRQVFEGEDPAAAWRQRFGWDRASRPRYLVVNPDITVAIGGGVPARETVYPASAAANLLFITSDQTSLLLDALNRLLPARTPGGLPDPVGSQMLQFLATYLPVERGQLGGLQRIASLPHVGSVRFTDEARTRAEVGIRTFFSGGTLLMEKQDGTWRVTGVGGTYVN